VTWSEVQPNHRAGQLAGPCFLHPGPRGEKTMRFEVTYHPATEAELRTWGRWIRAEYPGQDALIVGLVELIPAELAGRLEQWLRGLEPASRVHRLDDVVQALRQSPPPDTRERSGGFDRPTWATVLHAPTEVVWVLTGLRVASWWTRGLRALSKLFGRRPRGRLPEATPAVQVEIVHITRSGPSRPGL
jgi:hypothetical protein